MRVLMTADGVGGVFGFVADLCRELGQVGVEVTVATMGPPLEEGQRATLRALPGVRVEERACALEWMPDPWADVDAASEWLLQVASKVRPDVVHLNGYAHAVLDFGAPKLVVAHSCVLGWWRAVHGEAAPASFTEYARRVRAGLAAADAVVAPTRAMLDSLRVEHGHEGGSVVPNGVDPRAFRPGRKGPYFAAAGRFWDRAKNLKLLLDASPRLPWPVRVAGPGSGDAELPSSVQALGVLPREALARLLASAGAFVHPARYEPFGLAPLEAAHAGCALILGDIPSLREVWGSAALFVAPDDAGALVSAAEQVARSPALRAELSAGARAAARRYTSAATAAEYLRVYRALAPEGSRSVEEPVLGRHGSLHHVVVG